MSVHLIETSVLKITKVKISSLVWKIRYFKGQFLVLASLIAKPYPQFTPFFHCNWSPKNNLNQHCSTKPNLTTTNLTACWLGTLSTEWVIALQQHHPLEFNQATPYAYQMIALCLCNNMTVSLTEAPPHPKKKKIARSRGTTATGRPSVAPSAYFLEFPLISVNSRKLSGAHS